MCCFSLAAFIIAVCFLSPLPLKEETCPEELLSLSCKLWKIANNNNTKIIAPITTAIFAQLRRKNSETPNDYAYLSYLVYVLKVCHVYHFDDSAFLQQLFSFVSDFDFSFSLLSFP